MEIRAKNKMIEIFNLGLNSRVSRDEMQTKRPFGEKDMDYKILLLVYRDTGNHSAVWYPVVGCAWCYCMLSTHTEEYMMTMINVFFLCVTPFKEQALIFWCCNPRRALVLHCQPCSMLQEIVCVSGYGSQWHNETHRLLNARGAACVYVLGYQWYFIPSFNCTKVMHVCGFHNAKQFLVITCIFLYRCVAVHIFIGWNWAQMALM